MNILIAYATNSGSTFIVAEHIRDCLPAHHVDIRELAEMHPENFSHYDVIIFGSPSWDHEGKEGQPHGQFFTFFERFHDDLYLHGKKTVVYGLGDRSYHYFCGAVTVIQQWLDDAGAIRIHDPLCLNKFFQTLPQDAQREIDTWIKSVIASIE